MKQRLTIVTTLILWTVGPVLASVEDDCAFLKRYLPARDRTRVSDAYLQTNALLAAEARRTAPWRDEISDEIYREYILPYSSIGEDPDDWRPLFRKTFAPMVRDCRTAAEAAALLNAKVYATLGVRYDTRRDKADQSPFHSMRIHMASCTGLSILMIDAFRACGIPARLAGCNWTSIAGNHSWVEYHDADGWHFFGDATDDAPAPVDRSWFTVYAALADSSEPRTRIYATRWSPSADDTRFWLTWSPEDRPSDVPADDITASYRRFRPAQDDSRVAFVCRGPDGRRRPTRFRLYAAGSGKCLFDGTTYDETHDWNDHLVVTLPQNTTVRLFVADGTDRFRACGSVDFAREQQLVDLTDGSMSEISDRR